MTSQNVAVTSVIIFNNDATELSFSDGAKVELSPCGASFVYYERPSSQGQHPVGGGSRIQQRTEFVTSKFKDKVSQALECRNRFAERPYLCQQFLCDGSVLQLFADVKVVRWPKCPENVSGTAQSNGTIQVTSIDECSSLFLSANRQEFTTEFLCKLSQKDFPQRISKRQAKLIQQSRGDSEAAGRLSTDFDLKGDFERTAPNCSSKHSPQHDCMQDSPYLQTLITGKVPLRKSNQDSENHNPLSLNKPLEYCTGNVEVGHPSKDEISRGHESPKIEELIAVKHGYTWVVQHHTVEHCPECWKHPLHLAMNFDPKKHLRPPSTEKEPNSTCSSMVKGTPGLDSGVKPRASSDTVPLALRVLKDCNIKEKKIESENEYSDKASKCLQESLSDAVASLLPCPLPLACAASHLHHWRKDAGLGRVDLCDEGIPVGRIIKVWFSNGIIYRLSRTPQPAVQIYPGDGTLIKSVGGSGGFFTHVIPRGDGLDNRMLCLRSLPPDCPGASYSIAGVLTKASRLLQNIVQTDAGLIPREDRCCWKVQQLSRPSTSQNPTVILEESKVEGLGHFVAFSNGRVRVVFEDRTTLDTDWDFGSRVTGSYIDEEDSQIHSTHAASKIRKSFFESTLKKGVCQFLLPNGERKLVPVGDPREYHRYVMVAVEWAMWVASSPEERVNFYSSHESHPSRQDWAVRTELQKIKCFEYILENALSPGCEPKAAGSDDASRTIDPPPTSSVVEVTSGMSSGGFLRPGGNESSPVADTIPCFVRDALRRTSTAIRNIDSVLSKF